MTQPAQPQPYPGQWYRANDGRFYCWPDPTPYERPPVPPPMPYPPQGSPYGGFAKTPAQRWSTACTLLGIGGALLMVGSFLPWVVASALFLEASRSGVELGIGIVTLLLGLAVGVVALSVRGWRAPDWLVALLVAPSALVGLGAVLLGVAVLADDSSEFVQGRPGSGLLAVVAGCVLVVIGGIMAFRVPSPPTAPRPGPWPSA